MNKPAVYLVITIDTEADHSTDWTKSSPLAFKSVTESIPNVLQPVFKKYGAIGTYLLTTEVLEDDESVRILKPIRDESELGTHLHPEYIGPEKKYLKYAGTYSTEFSNNLDISVEKEKLSNLTRLFEEKIGCSSKVYRGGKFGFGDNTASSLASLGYLVDTSVTPGVSWRNIGGPNFTKFSDQPYFIKNKSGDKILLEVPVSIIFLNSVYKFFNRPVWLRPSFNSPHDMKRLVHKFISKYSSSDVIVLNMMFHSMEFYPGASPYSRNQEDCNRLIGDLESIIGYCREIGVTFCKLSHIRGLYA
ncbi:MAG: hypothetical protein Q7O04_06820 [Candidatus Omnitrophota bacterium]|nr:hypothetical protein [Candidatus Omnitrophota bacterium]